MTINWRILLGASVAAIIAFACLLIMNANLRARLAMAEAENVALHISNDNFKAEAEKQNRAVTALKTSADGRARRAAIFSRIAGLASAEYMADAATIAKASAGSDECRAAEALIETYRRGKK
jgi:hypothetical protein